MGEVSVHFLGQGLAPEALSGSCAVVVDVLRAGATITQALESGAREVHLHAEPDGAKAAAERDGRAGVVLGGERHCTLIPGFDLANSPQQYTAERVAGRTVHFTTTNGTRTALAASAAHAVLLGCFPNRAACADVVDEFGLRTHVLCAGTGGEITAEDVLFAGALVDALAARGWALAGDEARIARGYWASTGGVPHAVLGVLRASRGGGNLIRLGLDADIAFCARVDVTRVVPALDPPAPGAPHRVAREHRRRGVDS